MERRSAVREDTGARERQPGIAWACQAAVTLEWPAVGCGVPRRGDSAGRGRGACLQAGAVGLVSTP